MPTMDEYLAMMQPDPDATRKARIFQALGGLGAGLLGGGGWQRGLARGGLLANDAMAQSDAAAQAAQTTRMQQYKLAQGMADADAQRADAANFSQQVGGVLSNAPRLGNMGPGGPTPANAAAVAPPNRVEKLRQVAELMIQRGQIEGAQKLLSEAEKIEGTYSTTPQVGMGAGGAQFAQFSNKGGHRIAEGFTPPPDMQMLNLGDRTLAVDKWTVAPGATFTQGQTPESVDASKRGWANLALEREKFGYQQGRDKQGPASEPTDKPLTESQATAALYYGMMQSASKDIAGIDMKKIDNLNLSAARGNIPYFPEAAQNYLAGPDAQKYTQASLQWTEAMLRATTGATAPPEEVARTAKTFFPQVGDAEKTIAQKNARRADMEKLMAVKAGVTGARQAGDALGSSSAQAVKSQDEYDKLPSGAEYTAPDGSRRRKK